MEVCIEAVNFEHINAVSHTAKDTFVSLRVDGVQKQSPYSASQEWTFPSSAAQKHGRMEVFRCLTIKEVDLNALAETASEEELMLGEGSAAMRLKLSAVLPPTAEPDSVPLAPSSPAKWRELEATRLQYLQTHDVKGLVGKSVLDIVGVPGGDSVVPGTPGTLASTDLPQSNNKEQAAPSSEKKSKPVFLVRLECPDASEESLSGLFVCISLNGVQKQSRLAPMRNWRLPARTNKKGALSKNVGEVKVMQRSGDVLVDLTSSSQELTVPLPDANAMTFSMRIKGGEAFPPASKPLRRTWESKDAGFELLKARDMQGLIHNAFKSVLRDQSLSPEDLLFSKFFSKKLPPLDKRPSWKTESAAEAPRPRPYMARTRSNSSVRLAPLNRDAAAKVPAAQLDKPQVADPKLSAALDKKVENSRKAAEEAQKGKMEAEAKVVEKEAEVEAMTKQIQEKQRAMRALAAVRSQQHQGLKQNAEAERARLEAELKAVAAQKAVHESQAESEQKSLQNELQMMATRLDNQAKKANAEKVRLEAELKQAQEKVSERNAAAEETRFQQELEQRLNEELQKRAEEQEAAATQSAADQLCEELEKLEQREEEMAKQAAEEQERFRTELAQAAKEAAAKARQVAEEQQKRLQEELEQALQRQDAEEHQRLEVELEQARQEQAVRVKKAEEESHRRMEHELEQMAKQQEEEMERKTEEARERLRVEFEQAAQEQEARAKQEEEAQQERFRADFEQQLREQAALSKQAAEEERQRLQVELEKANRQQEDAARQAESEKERMRQEVARIAQEREEQAKLAAEKEKRLQAELQAAQRSEDGEEMALPEAEYVKAQQELHELEDKLAELGVELESTKEVASTAEQRRQEAETREREVQAEVQAVTQRYQESEAQKQRALDALAAAEAERAEAVKKEAAAKEEAEQRLQQELEKVAKQQDAMAEQAAEEQRRMRAELEQAAVEHAASALKAEEEQRQRLQQELEQAAQRQEELARQAAEEQQRLLDALERAREEKDEFGAPLDSEEQRLHEELQAAKEEQEARAHRAAEEQQRMLEELQRSVQEQAARAKQFEEETQERIRQQVEEMAKQQQEEMTRRTEEERKRLRAEFEKEREEQEARARQEEEEQAERLRQELDRVTQQQAELAKLVEDEQHQLQAELEKASQETLAMAEQADEEQQQRFREEMEQLKVAKQADAAQKRTEASPQLQHPLASRPAADALISMPASSVDEDMKAAAAKRKAESDAKVKQSDVEDLRMRLEAKAAEYKAPAFELPEADGSSVHEQAEQMAAQFAEERTWLHALEMMHRHVVEKAQKEAVEVERARFTLGWQPGETTMNTPVRMSQDDELNRRAEVSWMVAEDFAALREEQAIQRNTAIKAVAEMQSRPQKERQEDEARLKREILKADDLALRYQDAERKARKKAMRIDEQRDERLMQLEQQKASTAGSAASSALQSTAGMSGTQQSKQFPRSLATEAWEELMEATEMIEASSIPEQTLRLCVIRQLEYELDEMRHMAEEAKAVGDPSAEQWESTAWQLEMALAEVREEQQAAERQTRLEVFSANDVEWLSRSVGCRVDLE